MKKEIYLKDVVTLALDSDKCTGCGNCTVVCPHGVFVIKEKKAEIIERDACMECGACSQNCPFEAISVRSGVGCAQGIIKGMRQGSEPSCGCNCELSDCC